MEGWKNGSCAGSAHSKETEFCRPYGWRDERDAKNSVSAIYFLNLLMSKNPISVTDRTIIKNILIVTPLSLMGRGGTLLIYAVLANWFGVKQGMDFLYYHWGVAIFLTEILSSASVYSVLIPLLATERIKSHADANTCLRAIFSLYLICIPAICCVFSVVSYLISRFFFPQPNLSALVPIGILLGFSFFTIIAGIRWMLRGVLDAYQRFNLPAIVQGLRVPVVIGLIFLLKSSLGILSIVLALIIGELFQVMTLFIACRFSLKMRGLFNVTQAQTHWRKYPKTGEFIRQCLTMMGAAISDGINPVVDRGMASTLGPGSVSKLDYALRLCAIPETVTGVILPVLLSHWSAISADAGQHQLRRSVWNGVLITLVLMGPLIFVLHHFRISIVQLVYGHGVMESAEQLHVASVLGVYLIGVLPRLISRLLIRAHLSLQNVTFIFSATLIRTVFNPILNLVFMRIWGLEGVALSTALLSFPLMVYIGVAFWIASRREA